MNFQRSVFTTNGFPRIDWHGTGTDMRNRFAKKYVAKMTNKLLYDMHDDSTQRYVFVTDNEWDFLLDNFYILSNYQI